MYWRNQNHWILDTLALQPAKFFSKNKMGPTARRWASTFWPRWGLSTQGILQLKPCGWADAGRGTVQILNNGQNPSTVLSDADTGLKAPAVAGLGGGGGAAGPGEGRGRLQEAGGHWCGREISYLPTRTKINFREPARGVGQTGYSHLPLGCFSTSV